MRVVLHFLLSLILFFLLDLSSCLSIERLLVVSWWNTAVPVLVVDEMVHPSQVKVIVVAHSVFRLCKVFEILVITVQISRNVQWVRLECKQINVYLVW